MVVVTEGAILAAAVIGFGVLVELLATVSVQPSYQRFMAALAIASGLGGSIMLLALNFNLASVLIMFLSVYRAVNLGRLLERRMHNQYLQHSFRGSSLRLIGYQLLVVAAYGLWNLYGLAFHKDSIMLTASALIAVISGLIFYQTFVSLIKSRRFASGRQIASQELPTLSVLIPARNETNGLTQCLEAVIASTYPKLEIIVLDDCSQDKTPEIIKSLAHDGVRFISGQAVPDTWLAKNFAYRQLAQEATGEILLFMGVDVRMTPASIELLIEELIISRCDMLSVMPKRQGQSLVGAILQPMRYWWQVAIPPSISGHPPVLSTCWLILKKQLDKQGGFESSKRAIEPEAALSAALAHRYRFVWADNTIGITTIKSIPEQLATAIRSRYPQLHRRPERVALLSLFELTVLCLPFIVLILGLFGSVEVNVWRLLTVSALLLFGSHLAITFLTNPRIWPLAVFSFPIIVLAECFATNLSMYKYEFSVVEWKGRNICLPVMHVVPSLPRLD